MRKFVSTLALLTTLVLGSAAAQANCCSEGGKCCKPASPCCPK